MDIIEKIQIVSNIIIKYFYDNCMHKSYCLAQSYLLYKYIQNNVNNDIKPKLIKGFIINHKNKIFYRHFWVVYNNIIYDIATKSYLLDYPEFHREHIELNRVLTKSVPDMSFYTNIDNSSFELLRTRSYEMCLNDRFLEDVKNNAIPSVYDKIKYIYNKIINK